MTYGEKKNEKNYQGIGYQGIINTFNRLST